MAEPRLEPNFFELRDEDTEITFATSSVTGPLRFSYAGPQGERSFSGEEIELLDTTFGSEVTVTFESLPEFRTLTLTVVLPGVRLMPGGDAYFETFAVLTTTATTGAGFPPGATQTYALLGLEGVAKSVTF